MQIPYRNEEPIYLTAEGIEQLRKRLAHLKKVLPELAAEAARTAAYGDRSDNAEYKQAKGALRFTHREIYKIENQLKRAVAIIPGRNTEGTIHLGSMVTLKTANKEEKIFEIVGPQETDPNKGRISNQSPLGLALMNHVVGDVIIVKSENGERIYTILEVN